MSWYPGVLVSRFPGDLVSRYPGVQVSRCPGASLDLPVVSALQENLGDRQHHSVVFLRRNVVEDLRRHFNCHSKIIRDSFTAVLHFN